VFGILAAASGIDKFEPGESAWLEKHRDLRMTVVVLPRKAGGAVIMPQRLQDYHTAQGIRHASGKVDKDATVETHRQYLLDARFGVLLEGEGEVLVELEKALRNPTWGVWLGRKCCIPASPLLPSSVAERDLVWRQLLLRAGFEGTEPLSAFERIEETAPDDKHGELLEDLPVGYGREIGERHGPRWVHRVHGAPIPSEGSDAHL
jgi:CRISPR system Cascade subunit CasD